MPDLLLELFSEEIPARMQRRAAEELQKMVTDGLVSAGLTYEGAKAFATPRRLALAVHGVPVRQPDVNEERKGPRVGAPDQAIAGFLKSAGLGSISEAKIAKDPKKGEFYVALIEKPGRPAIEVIAEIIPQVVRAFPWPKAMRWGEGELSWVRPLHSMVATFGPETEEPEIVPLAIDGLAAGDVTYGHRFLAPAPIRVRRLEDYARKLEQAKVVLDPARREQMILADARNLAFAQGYELVEDPGLLAEAAGLVEWPVVLMGAFDASFLAIPPEVIRTTIRNNQKCFVLREAQTARLANKFILVANTEAADGGKAIVAGNERVIRARLSDAKFFYETDLKIGLEDRLPKLKEIVFHERLGTQAERVERIGQLADYVANALSSRPDFFHGKRLTPEDLEREQEGFRKKVGRAARLAKADLVTEMVGEFPELQGLMGKYYALAQGEDERVARAIEEHYKPLGPSDRVPTDPVSVAVAIADKIDTLVGFWAIDEKPTGSKDPYALRRAALGIIRLVIESAIRLPLMSALIPARVLVGDELRDHELDELIEPIATLRAAGLSENRIRDIWRAFEKDRFPNRLPDHAIDAALAELEDLLSFFADRLKVQLRDQGARHDLVDAVFALEGQDDLVLIVRRVEALAQFLDTEDGRNLLAGYKRATSIIRIEEKRDGREYRGMADPNLLRDPIEKHLWDTIESTVADASRHVAREDFAGAMATFSTLRTAVDNFFDKVTVNVDDPKLRENRLKLLNQIREATRAVADFSKIEG